MWAEKFQCKTKSQYKKLDSFSLNYLCKKCSYVNIFVIKEHHEEELRIKRKQDINRHIITDSKKYNRIMHILYLIVKRKPVIFKIKNNIFLKRKKQEFFNNKAKPCWTWLSDIKRLDIGRHSFYVRHWPMSSTYFRACKCFFFIGNTKLRFDLKKIKISSIKLS